ncbi:hypothetical protein AB395_00006670 (plasmid) [Sinorhizobium fredii CCBAU 45436]|nr:hypothetical protein AB395_00006670 [Sinorhizobium fredii CCBAU 45436]
MICDRLSMDDRREFLHGDLEVLTSGKAGREGHRHWPDEVKARDRVGESAAGRDGERGGGAVWAEAEPSIVLATMARQGKLVLPAPEDAVEFAAMIVETTVAAPAVKEVPCPEIIVGPVTIRLEEGASVARIVAIARALAASARPFRQTRIMVATKPVDFRKGHDGLAALVKNELRKDPFTGTVFVFRSRKADRLKLIYWDGSGVVMAYKRLEEHTFTWPGIKDGLMTLSHAQFEALFAGLDWRRVRAVEARAPEAIE